MGYQYEVGSEEEGEIENQFDSILTKVYLLMNTGNILFLVSFGFLIFGIYGKYQNRHGFFFPMIVMEWLQCWIPLVVLAMGCIASIGNGMGQENEYSLQTQRTNCRWNYYYVVVLDSNASCLHY